MADIGWYEEVDVNDPSDGARVGNQATLMVRATQRADTPVCVRYKKTLHWRVFVINSR